MTGPPGEPLSLTGNAQVHNRYSGVYSGVSILFFHVID